MVDTGYREEEFIRLVTINAQNTTKEIAFLELWKIFRKK